MTLVVRLVHEMLYTDCKRMHNKHECHCVTHVSVINIQMFAKLCVLHDGSTHLTLVIKTCTALIIKNTTDMYITIFENVCNVLSQNMCYT